MAAERLGVTRPFRVLDAFYALRKDPDREHRGGGALRLFRGGTMHRPLQRGTHHRRRFAVAAVVLLVAVAAGCTPARLRITTDPALFPAFSTSVSDYVTRCSGSEPVEVSVSAPSDTSVSVDGTAFRSGTFTSQVGLDVGQRFTMVVQGPDRTSTHHVRCLPSDFPQWTAHRTGRTQAEYYVTSSAEGLVLQNYPAIFDVNGVPVWWGPRAAVFFSLLLPDGNIAWNTGGTFEEHRFDGSLVRTYSVVNGRHDFHDIVVLPNGNHVMVAGARRFVDLSSWGGPTSAEIIDHVVQEIDPQGTVVWSWTVGDHIPVTETTPKWRAVELADPGGPFGNAYDAYHYNSVEPTPDGGYILSFRHLDAVYKVDKQSGDIVWKIGGTPRTESLEVIGDPVFQTGGSGGFGGQHDARLLPDGTLTLYDNGTNRDRAPRGLAYHVDEVAKTATLVRQLKDPLVDSSACCGSSRALPGGNWVLGWGGNSAGTPDITESTSFGARLFELDFTVGSIYRGLPVLPGRISITALRSGMDAQHPR